MPPLLWKDRDAVTELNVSKRLAAGQSQMRPLTAPVLVLSIVQSGMILESVTIQLLILSLRRLSTDGMFKNRNRLKEMKYIYKHKQHFLMCLFF